MWIETKNMSTLLYCFAFRILPISTFNKIFFFDLFLCLEILFLLKTSELYQKIELFHSYFFHKFLYILLKYSL